MTASSKGIDIQQKTMEDTVKSEIAWPNLFLFFSDVLRLNDHPQYVDQQFANQCFSQLEPTCGHSRPNWYDQVCKFVDIAKADTTAVQTWCETARLYTFEVENGRQRKNCWGLEQHWWITTQVYETYYETHYNTSQFDISAMCAEQQEPVVLRRSRSKLLSSCMRYGRRLHFCLVNWSYCWSQILRQSIYPAVLFMGFSLWFVGHWFGLRWLWWRRLEWWWKSTTSAPPTETHRIIHFKVVPAKHWDDGEQGTRGHSNAVTVVLFSPFNQMLMTVSRNCMVAVTIIRSGV